MSRKTALLVLHVMWLAAGVPFVAAPHDTTQYVEGEVIVAFKTSASVAVVQETLGARSLLMSRHFRWLSEQRRQQLGLIRSSHKTTSDLIAELKQDATVESVEPNYLRWPCGGVQPKDPLFPELWGLQNTGQLVDGSSGAVGADVSFLDAWGMACSTSLVAVVAVVDTGVDYTHPDLAGNLWTNPGEVPNNSVDDDGNGYVDDSCGYDFVNHTSDPADAGYHGTHVAGIIAAVGNNGCGVIGVAHKAKVLALKVSGDGESITSSAEIEAIQYAAMMKSRGVNVVAINASYGGGGYSTTERAAIAAASEAGIVFCAAAGNDGGNNDSTPMYPASYRLPNMVVVAATDQNDALAKFSNYGATSVDLGAPGVNILSALPTSLGTNVHVRQAATVYDASAFSYSGLTTGITATIYDCGLGYPTSFPSAVNGNIALIQRGTLYFKDKVANAMAAGARAAIIYNNASGSVLGTLQCASNWIPAVAISQQDGTVLRSALPATGTVVNPDLCYQFLDGTSMATPHVAGAIAFAAMNFPDDGMPQRIQRILSSVDVISGLVGKVKTGGRLNLMRIVDGNDNGLPDWWEHSCFAGSSNIDPNADPDQDGSDNRMEWLAGTDPTNASSCLRATVVTLQGTNGPTVCWQSTQGKHYRLERATNLLAGFTCAVLTNIPAVSPTNTETDTTVGTEGACFYRIVLEQ